MDHVWFFLVGNVAKPRLGKSWIMCKHVALSLQMEKESLDHIWANHSKNGLEIKPGPLDLSGIKTHFLNMSCHKNVAIIILLYFLIKQSL